MKHAKKKERKKPEFSKVIIVSVGATNLFIMVFSFIMMWRTLDLSPLMYLIPAAAAEMATGTAFYYNKAKLENKIKLMAAYKVEPECGSFETYN